MPFRVLGTMLCLPSDQMKMCIKTVMCEVIISSTLSIYNFNKHFCDKLSIFHAGSSPPLEF